MSMYQYISLLTLCFVCLFDLYAGTPELICLQISSAFEEFDYTELSN